MNNIYDNGYKLLGAVKNIKKDIENNIRTSDIEEQLYEILEELKEYKDNDIVVIDYDNPMGYTIEKWEENDIVKEND